MIRRLGLLALLGGSLIFALPQPASVSPMSAVGSAVSYSFTFVPDSASQSPLQTFYIITDADLFSKCLFAVVSPSTLYVMNDAGTAWLPSVPVNSSQENSYCRVSGGSLAATPGVSGGITLAATVTFKVPPMSAGNKGVFLAVIDSAGQSSGWRDMNAILCVGSCSTSSTPAPGAVSPVNGISPDQTFSFTYSDPDGYADISATQVIFNQTLNGANACYFTYQRSSGTIYLVSDDGSSIAGSGQVGAGGGGLSNSQCTIYPGTASVIYLSATQLRMSIRVVFNPLSAAMAAQLTIYRGVQDFRGQNSGWVWDSANVWWYPAFSIPLTQSAYTASPPAAASIPCKLQVNSPSYSISRVNGNRIRLSALLTLAAPVSSPEVWAAKVQIVVYFKPTGGSKNDISLFAGIPDSTTTINSGTAVGTAFGVTGSPQVDNTITLNVRGSGEYSVSMRTSASLTSGAAGCSGATSNLPLVNASTQQPIQLGESAPFPVERPTITTNGIQGIWWFGAVGKDDAPNAYYSSVLISGAPNWSGTLTYSVTQDPVRVQMSCTSCNNPVIQAVAVSTSGCSQDIAITASLDGFAASAPVLLMVNRPGGRFPQPTYFNSSAPGGGYWSKDYFTFTDLCSMSMPSVAHRESFPGGLKTYWEGGASSFWNTAPDAAGWTAYRQDTWSTWDDIVVACAISSCVPQSLVPSGFTSGRSNIGSLLQQKIVALQQMWWVGDSMTGGFLANQCNQTLYQDHAEDINFW